VGVHPDLRGEGLARTLYERFFATARADGRTEVQCITGPPNTGSIAFHRAMGFEVTGPIEDYESPGEARMSFRRPL
jgi:ribosomal protein S18 acetylase RimI-like enzyme